MSKKPKQKLPKQSKKGSSTLKQNVLRNLTKYLLLSMLGAIFISVLFIYSCMMDLPDLEKISKNTASPHIIIRDVNKKIIAEYGDIYGDFLPYLQLSNHLINAVIATEDRKFFQHSGIDYFGIIRAAVKNQLAGRIVQGGSTITQQLVKIIFLSPERKIKRKIQEALLAIKLEQAYSKEEILALYLNRVFLGHNHYGVNAAAKGYFGKDARHLSIYESAFIAGMLKAPSRYAPPQGTAEGLLRAQQVIKNMLDNHFITPVEARNAVQPKFISVHRHRMSNNYFFADYIIKELNGMLLNPAQNLEVFTSFESETQYKLETAFKKVISNRKDCDALQYAGLVISKNGAIKAMIGSNDYRVSQFNRAVEAKRQSGSLFKFFVYVAALENGYRIDDEVEDKQITIKQWMPRNFSRQYLGKLSLLDAFAYSINTVTVQVSEKIGRTKVIKVAQRLGIKDVIPDVPSVALGTSTTSLLDLVYAYAVLPNDGILPSDQSILQVVDDNYQSLYNPSSQSIFNTTVLDASVVSDMKKMLYAAVQYGTGKTIQSTKLDIYGKTGTSQNHRDAWFIGVLDNEMVIGIWLGRDDDKSMHSITGGTIPATIFKEFVSLLN